MTPPLIVGCPKCRHRVRLRGPEDVGKTIRCTQCGEAYAAQPESDANAQTEPANKPDDDEMDAGRLAFESEVAALNEPKRGEGAAPPPPRVSPIRSKDRRPAPPILKPVVQPPRASPPDKPAITRRERSAESTPRAKPIEESAEAAPPPPATVRGPESNQTHETDRTAAAPDQDNPADPFALAASVPSTIDDELGDDSAESGSAVLLRPRKRRRREQVFVEPRSRRKEKNNPWTINRVACAVGTLIAIFAWSFAAYFYINSDSSRIDEKLRPQVVKEEQQEEDENPWGGDPNAVEIGSVVVKRPQQRGFLVNAIVQVSNVLNVGKWTARNGPSVLFAFLFFEGLVAYYWLGARRLEREWAESEQVE